MATTKTKDSRDAQKNKDIWYILTYVLTFISGLVVFITVGQKNARLKFHALQAIMLGIIMIIIGVVFGWLFFPLAGLVNFLLWIYGLYVGYRAYEYNEDVSMPVIGDLAKQYSK